MFGQNDPIQWIEKQTAQQGREQQERELQKKYLQIPYFAPVAQWIEQWFPKPRAQVRFLPGALSNGATTSDLFRIGVHALPSPRRFRVAAI